MTGAVFSDFDQDGDQDLMLSLEWGAIKLFKNTNGRFHDATVEAGLSHFKGWWNGVTTGDFNNDGRPDILATNWGRNSAYKTTTENPIRLFYDDFDCDSRIEIVNAYYDQEIAGYVPRRRLYELYDPIPTIIQRVSSHRDFARSSLSKMLNMNIGNIPSKEITTLRHALFLNQKDGFKAYALPDEAQISTAFHTGVLDYDNDGNEDLFLSQNFFSLPKFFFRQDTGRGLLLKGDGTGQFQAVPGQKSGIKIYGHQRGAAVSDFNKDGKTDIAVSQNSDALKLYLNKHIKQGISNRLTGPPENKNAIGSNIRLVYEDGSKGPRREIQAGSGYWSQNSFEQVMGFTKAPTKVEVTWFDSSVQTYGIDSSSRTYTFQYQD